jgi:FkbM family methyltransferase
MRPAGRMLVSIGRVRAPFVKATGGILAALGLLEAAKYKYRLHEPGGIRRLLGLSRRPGFTRLQKNRVRLMKTHGVDAVLDVGANAGQFALELRELGFAGRIVSFEPLVDAYRELTRYAAFDKQWTTVNLAIGDHDHPNEINVSQNSQSSSILGILPVTLDAAPSARYVGTQSVDVRALDAIIDEYLDRDTRPYLKIDTQGYERQVLAGATRSLAERIVGVQVECSLVPLYEREAGFEEILGLLEEQGFALMSIEPEFSNDSTGQLLQADLIFYRTKSLPE